MKFFLWFVVTVFSASLLLVSDVHAAACCISATSGGVGRLRIWEKAAIGTQLIGGYGFSSWNSKGEWAAYGDSYGEQSLTLAGWGIIRLNERLQLYTRYPLLLNRRQVQDKVVFGGGLAPVSAGARYDILMIGEYLELPAWAVNVGLISPTGRRMDQSIKEYGVDTTQRGSWSFSLGNTFEYTHFPFFAQIQLGTQFYLPFWREDTGKFQHFGLNLSGGGSTGIEAIADTLIFTAGSSLKYDFPLRIENDFIDSSERYIIDVFVSSSWLIDPYWTVLFSFNSNLFGHDFGRNIPAQLTGTLGVRYGFF